MEVQVWQLALPLPAIILITVGFYLLLLGAALWVRYCLKDRCSVPCADCCSGVSLNENCFKMAEVCDCRLPSVRSCLGSTCSGYTCLGCTCPSPSELWDQRQCRCPTSGGGEYETEGLCQGILHTPLCNCPFTCPSVTCPSVTCPSVTCPSVTCEAITSRCPSFSWEDITEAPLYRCLTCCSNLDCACTCQPPECDTCNCLCFEIRIK